MEKRLKEGWVSGGELAKVGSGSRIVCEEGEEQEEGRMKEGEGGRCFTSMSPRRRISMGATASSSSKPVARMHRAVFFPPPVTMDATSQFPLQDKASSNTHRCATSDFYSPDIRRDCVTEGERFLGVAERRRAPGLIKA